MVLLKVENLYGLSNWEPTGRQRMQESIPGWQNCRCADLIPCPGHQTGSQLATYTGIVPPVVGISGTVLPGFGIPPGNLHKGLSALCLRVDPNGRKEVILRFKGEVVAAVKSLLIFFIFLEVLGKTPNTWNFKVCQGGTCVFFQWAYYPGNRFWRITSANQCPAFLISRFWVA